MERNRRCIEKKHHCDRTWFSLYGFLYLFITLPSICLFVCLFVGNYIRLTGAKAIAEALKENTTLKTLNLSSKFSFVYSFFIKLNQLVLCL